MIVEFALWISIHIPFFFPLFTCVLVCVRVSFPVRLPYPPALFFTRWTRSWFLVPWIEHTNASNGLDGIGKRIERCDIHHHHHHHHHFVEFFLPIEAWFYLPAKPNPLQPIPDPVIRSYDRQHQCLQVPSPAWVGCQSGSRFFTNAPISSLNQGRRHNTRPPHTLSPIGSSRTSALMLFDWRFSCWEEGK